MPPAAAGGVAGVVTASAWPVEGAAATAAAGAASVAAGTGSAAAGGGGVGVRVGGEIGVEAARGVAGVGARRGGGGELALGLDQAGHQEPRQLGRRGQGLLDAGAGGARVVARRRQLGGDREEVGGLGVLAGVAQEALGAVAIAGGERALGGGDQQVVGAARRRLAAQPGQPVPRRGGLGVAALLLVQPAQGAQRALVLGVVDQALLHRAGRAPRHAGGAEVEAELVAGAQPQLARAALAHRQGLVDPDRALVLAAAAEQRAEREVRLDVLDVVLDDLAQLVDHGVVVTGDQVVERAHVRARRPRRALEHAVVGHVVAADQDAGGQRAQADQGQQDRGAHQRSSSAASASSRSIARSSSAARTRAAS
ncbi:MAG: hypothetical protein H6709_15750 [Kofleriaceae bacterium]|nr:hypothetical protein [Kofleriaceae bacterium]